MLNVTKVFLPEINEYIEYLKKIWENGWITNNGPLVRELEEKLKNKTETNNLFFCSNGTVVLQLAIKALGLTKEIITTPYSYVATSNSILWENCTPVFVDVNEIDLNINAHQIESAITENTEAILATHVYGNPCQHELIAEVAKKYNLKIIYDGAHAFGSKLNGESILKLGDISTCSLHATKLFHSVEGGLIMTNDNITAEKIMLMRQFGHVYDDYFAIGINAKNSEFHAAMGLCVLPHLNKIINHRKISSELYDAKLNFKKITRPVLQQNLEYNYAYYPVIFEREQDALNVKTELEKNNIYPRRYFYPSLNELPFYKKVQSCPVSESASKRVLSLPLSHEISEVDIDYICKLINSTIY